MAYRKIPRQLITDKGAAVSKDIVHLADMELAKLEQELALANQQFPEVQQLRRTRNFGHAVIECFAGFGLAWAKVTVKGGKGEPRTVTIKRCLCSPCLALGIITAVDVMTEDDYLDGLRFTYDIDICINGKAYVPITDQVVRSAGWERYSVGQIVLVTLDQFDLSTTLAFDCCAEGKCLMQKLLFEDPATYALTITPFTLGPVMKEWITSSQTLPI